MALENFLLRFGYRLKFGIIRQKYRSEFETEIIQIILHEILKIVVTLHSKIIVWWFLRRNTVNS